MLGYVLRRLLYTSFVMLSLTFVVFMVLQLVPGDPVLVMLGENFTQETYRAWRVELGLDDPLLVQYGRYLADLVRGDLGLSFRTQRPVIDTLAPAVPATLRLAGAALFVSVVVGVSIGVVSAARRNSVYDRLAMSFAMVGVSAPYFWVGMVLMYIFAFQLAWVPVFGDRGWSSLVLPAVTLGANYAAMLARVTRSTMLEVLANDYVRTARSKGVGERRVIFRHAFANAAIPVVTLIGLQLGMLFSGSIVVETVFAWPGVGSVVITAVQARDVPVIQATVLFMGLAVSLANLVVDLLYGVLDPRIKYA